MIQGINLTLSPPEIIWKSNKLKKHSEIESLMHSLVTYFKQKGVIYDAELTVSNNEWMEKQGDFGKYKQRIDYSFTLRYLTRVVLYDTYIEFNVLDNDITNTIRVNIGKDFFYFFDWEKTYYEHKR